MANKHCRVHATLTENHYACKHGGCISKNNSMENCNWCAKPDLTWEEVVKGATQSEKSMYKEAMKELDRLLEKQCKSKST